ncbi:MAG: peptidyl-tRNA hydrolase [Bacteroides sp.]
MYILVNEDVKIGKGKLAGQVGHAVATYFWRYIQSPTDNQYELLKDYMVEQKKIILKAPQPLCEQLEQEGYVRIRDLGYTQLEPNTLTCINLGIYNDGEEPEFIKELKLY